MAVARARLATERITMAEFEQMPQFGQNYELIDGGLVEKEMPGEEHSDIADFLLKAIWRLDPDEKLGKAWREVSVAFPGDNTRQPDLCFVTATRRQPKTKGALRVMPDFVVEVWSPGDVASKSVLESTRQKMLIYPTNGVKITWCINPKAQEVEVLYADKNKPDMVYELSDVLSGEDVLPGLQIKVAELFQ